MNGRPTLYVPIGAPLVEVACAWEVALTEWADREELWERLRTFPYREMGAYGLGVRGECVIVFRTGLNVHVERVCEAVIGWCGHAPRSLPPPVVYEKVPPLDHRGVVTELKRALDARVVRIVTRVGLTLATLQEDMFDLCPELVLLCCHGTDEGCVLLEDGRGVTHMVPGERLFPYFSPRPCALLLAACRSETILTRAGAGADWTDAAVVHVLGETPIETAACAGFASVFFRALLGGKRAAEAFDRAQRRLEDDPVLGSLSVAPHEVAPSKKFRINPAGASVRLGPMDASAAGTTPAQDPCPPFRRSMVIRGSSERFVGRQREMSQVIDVLLPRPTGMPRGPDEGERRIVTLTKEGGIGKTAMALAVADWAHERGCFSGGILELSCERLTTGEQLLDHLLALLGVAPEAQRGDRRTILAEALRGNDQDKEVLLVLDNLDDLLGKDAPDEVRQQAVDLLEASLAAAPGLRILATCRWPLAIANHEYVLEVLPLAEDDARDVFISHLESEAHQQEVTDTWDEADSPVRQLVHMSGRHPQSLQLLAHQMGRKGMTFAKLRNEAREELLGVLEDPMAADNETDRLKKVAVSYELSYRHLSDRGKRLFERLSRLPAGVWCGQVAEDALRWEELFGEHWRKTLEKELDYFALVHFETNGADDDSGTFRMLNPMREFARKKYGDRNHARWERRWITFWRQHLEDWDDVISGRVPLKEGDRSALAAKLKEEATELLRRTQPNWQAAYEHLLYTDVKLAAWFLLVATSFCRLSGQQVALKRMADKGVEAMRGAGYETGLARCLVTLGDVEADLGRRDEARKAYTEALAIYQRLAGEQPETFKQELAMAHNNLGDVQSELGDWETAWESFTAALAIQRPLARVDPDTFEPDLASTLSNLGAAQSIRGDSEAARASFVEALAIQRRLADARPATFEPAVATTLNNLGNVQSDLDQWQAARESYVEALGIYRHLASSHPAAYRKDVAMTLNNLGDVQVSLRELDAARESLVEALEIYQQLAEQCPAAFARYYYVALSNYTAVIPEDVADPWWQLWRTLPQDPLDTPQAGA